MGPACRVVAPFARYTPVKVQRAAWAAMRRLYRRGGRYYERSYRAILRSRLIGKDADDGLFIEQLSAS